MLRVELLINEVKPERAIIRGGEVLDHLLATNLAVRAAQHEFQFVQLVVIGTGRCRTVPVSGHRRRFYVQFTVLNDLLVVRFLFELRSVLSKNPSKVRISVRTSESSA